MSRFKFAVIKSLAAGLVLAPIISTAATMGVPVRIHAVNYSDQEFKYVVMDPNDHSNIGGGESISRFGTGGSMCCYILSEKWRSGSKVEIAFKLLVSAQPDRNLPEDEITVLADIPQYGEAQDLWVVRDARGQMSIVISEFQPDHPKWPGKFKGWPVPSLVYQRERADIAIEKRRNYIDLFKKLSDDMRSEPEKTAKKCGKFRKNTIGNRLLDTQDIKTKTIKNFSFENIQMHSKRVKKC